MNNTYQFYAILKEKYAAISFRLIVIGALLLVGLIVCSVVFLPKDNAIIKYFMATIVVFLFVYAYVMTKICNRLAGGEWHIRFNNDSIETSLNKKPYKTYPLARLTMVELFNDKAPLGQSFGIRIVFTKVDGDTIVPTDELYLEETVLAFSSATKKSNVAIFKQFIADLNKHILQPDFQLIDAKAQYILKLGRVRSRQPAKFSYFRKNTDTLFSKET